MQDRIYKGRGIAARRLGLPCDIFRPQNPTAPLATPVGRIPVAFNAGDSKYLKASLYGKPVWYADCDGRLTCPGDYLVRVTDGAIWFIGAQQQLLPIVAIDCNASVSVHRTSVSVDCGPQGYAGLQSPPDILGTADSPWPASILLGGRALAAIGLPGDVKEGGWRILLPPSVPIPILAGDLMIDDLQRRFAVESAELTDLGWRITANEAHA